MAVDVHKGRGNYLACGIYDFSPLGRKGGGHIDYVFILCEDIHFTSGSTAAVKDKSVLYKALHSSSSKAVAAILSRPATFQISQSLPSLTT